VVNTSNRINPETDLQEVANRHDTATAVVDTLNRALDVIPLLSAEITRLRRRLVTTLNDFSNLLAAARATLSAYADGEDDPLFYLRDELNAQGQLRAEQCHQERPQ
jgi:DNA-binding transcriptional regulator YiaG